MNISGAEVVKCFEEAGLPVAYRCHNSKPNPEDPGVLDVKAHNERGYAYVTEGTYEVPWNGGTGYWRPFEKAFEKCNVRTKVESVINSLITSIDNEVLGVVVADVDGGNPQCIKARKGVVVAAGGFTNNEDMVHNCLQSEVVPSAYGGAGLSQADECDGAGIRALLAIGADTRTMGQVTFNCGGIGTNAKTEVVDRFGNVIPRAYAAGRTQGGVFGSFPRMGCGFQTSAAIDYGRIAGQEAAKLENRE